MESEVIIKVENLVKEYYVGQYGKGTLTADLQSWWAKVRKKEDPNSKIGEGARLVGSKFKALRGVSFEIEKGDRVGIIGGNGAGKSTLLKLLCKITAPTSGRIMYNGRIASMLEVGTGFNPEMTGRENIYLNGAILGMTKEEIDSKFDQIVEFSECADFIDTPVKRYSSGMYVKLAFSVAAHLDSEIVIMDEVLAVGDMAFQKKCLKKMRELATEENKTILYVSHNMITIKELCNKGIVLNQGKITYSGDVEQAISIYNSCEYSEINLVDFTNVESKSGSDGSNFYNIQFSNENKMTYYGGEDIVFTIRWTPGNIKNDYYFRIIIRNEQQNIIGMTNCFLGSNFEKQDVRNDSFSFATGLLSKGNYFFEYEVSAKNTIGDLKTVFWPTIQSKIVIDGFQEENTCWDKQNWGDIRFNKLERVRN